jgi:5-methylcytosine-specific restriction endonuclease McrA
VEENLYTLKLDAAWKPIEIIKANRAFIMYWTGRAKPVLYYDLGPVENLKYPSVVILKSHISKRSFTIPCNRKNVFWRDDYICQYCGNKFSYGNLTMDHVVPKSKGGHKIWTNIVSACHKCNNKKGSKSIEEANMFPINMPKFPKVKITDMYRNIKFPDVWKQFLF